MLGVEFTFSIDDDVLKVFPKAMIGFAVLMALGMIGTAISDRWRK